MKLTKFLITLLTLMLIFNSNVYASISNLSEKLSSSSASSDNTQTQDNNTNLNNINITSVDTKENDILENKPKVSNENNIRYGYVDVNTWLNVRTGPGIQYQRIGKLYRNQKVEILETFHGWHKIKWQGSTAWVCARYVSDTELNDDDDTNTADYASNVDTQPVQLKNGILLNVPKRSQFSRENIVNGIDYRYSWCGPNAFAMVLEYFGIKKSAYECAKLVEYTFKQRVGTPISGIVNGAHKVGFTKTRLYYGQSLDWLKSQVASGRPVIVGVNTRWRGHYIVVVGFNGNNVIVNDPGKGSISRVQYEIPKEKFLAYWSSKGRRAVVIRK